MHMQLPGGVVRDGRRHRGVRLAPLSGRVEMALMLGRGDGAEFHAGLSEAIAVGVEDVGGLPMNEALAAELCVGDRQYLARVLGARRGGDEVWLSPGCPHCGGRFDVQVRQSELPVKEAGAGYPLARVRLGGGELICRVPTGVDEVSLTESGARDPKRWLVDRLIEDAPAGFGGAAGLDEDELARVEVALEEVAPEVGTVIATSCPSCGRATRVSVSPYVGLLGDEGDLLAEVHQLAWAYHWSESEILGLPTGRRRRYLALVDRARGVRG